MPDRPLAANSKNQLLASLLKLDHERLLPYLHPVDLLQGDVIYSAGDDIKAVYFPENAVVALLSTLEDGSTTEVGLIVAKAWLVYLFSLAGDNPGMSRSPSQRESLENGCR